MAKTNTPRDKARNQLGRLLAELRQSRGYSMQKLAKATNISAAYICRIEAGERHPSRELLQTIADILIPETNQSQKDELLVAAGFAPVNYKNFMGREDVLAIYQKALAHNPDDFKSFIAFVLTLIRSRLHEQARIQINEGMQRFDDMVQLQVLMAALELSKGNYQQAIVFQQEALRYFSLEDNQAQTQLRRVDLYLSLGVMYFEQGHQLAYQSVLVLNKGQQADAEHLKQQALESLNQAAQTFVKGLDDEPEDVYVLDELARVHFTIAYLLPSEQAEPHWSACIKAFEQTLGSADKHSLGYHSLLQSTAFLALAYSKYARFEQAWFSLNLVEACLPNYWLIHYVKACYFGLKIQKQYQGLKTKASQALFDDCLKSLKKAISISDQDNRALEEALIDPDLEAVRRYSAEAFQSITQKVESTS